MKSLIIEIEAENEYCNEEKCCCRFFKEKNSTFNSYCILFKNKLNDENDLKPKLEICRDQETSNFLL